MAEGERFVVLAIDAIKVEDRHRKDLGDLASLAASIQDVGLQHPVVVNTDHRLISGQRRLEACRLLGLTEVMAHVTDTLTDAAALLRAERDENTCRKDFAPSEAIAIGLRLEELEVPKAEERMKAGVATEPSGQWPQGSVREIVGPAVGLSGRTYARAKSVVEAAENPALAEEVREAARRAVEEMDATGKISKAYNELTAVKEKAARDRIIGATDTGRLDNSPAAAAKRRERIKAMVEKGHTAAQIAEEVGMAVPTVRQIARDLGVTTADEILGKRRRIDSNRVVTETVNALEGLAHGAGLVDVEALDRARIEEWASSLSNSLRSLNRLAKQLKEKTL